MESIYLSSCNRLAKVSIIGAGNVGRTLSQRIIERNLADVCLLDIVEGLPQGIALDLTEAQGLEAHHCEIMGTNNYQDTADSDIVVLTAGVARKPGMSRDDLLKINAKIVTSATQESLKYSPNAIYLIVTNPLDVMAYLVWKTSSLPAHRVMGMAGVLDSARLQTFIARKLGVSIHDVQGMVLGGHGDLMLPIPRYCTVSGIPITELMSEETIEALIERTRNGGAEIVRLLKTGSAYYAPASSACNMIEAILFNQSRLLTAAAYLDGEYGLKDIFLGVPCRLGSNGIERILELNLTDQERKVLRVSGESVRDSINVALEFLK